MQNRSSTISERGTELGRRFSLFLNWWPQIALGTATIPSWCVAIVPQQGVQIFFMHFSQNAFNLLLIITAIGLLLFGVIGTVRRSPNLQRLESEAEELRKLKDSIQLELEHTLKSLMIELGLSVGNEAIQKPPHARVTLYQHNDNSKEFNPVIRVSDSPQFKKLGRSSYPDSEGIIGQGWNEGSAYVVRLKDERKKWEKQLKTEWNIPLEVSQKLKMQSRSLAAVQIRNRSEALGILVFESINPHGVTSKTRDVVLASPNFQAICRLLSLYKNQVNSL